MSDTPQQVADVATLQELIDIIREMRGRTSVKRSKTDPLYHAFCHSIYDLNLAIDQIQEGQPP